MSCDAGTFTSVNGSVTCVDCDTGEFQDQQRPIGAIQALTGLTFGKLAQRDVLAGADIEFAVALKDVRDIMLM